MELAPSAKKNIVTTDHEKRLNGAFHSLLCCGVERKCGTHELEVSDIHRGKLMELKTKFYSESPAIFCQSPGQCYFIALYMILCQRSISCVSCNAFSSFLMCSAQFCV
jgi:hypothetical protein